MVVLTSWYSYFYLSFMQSVLLNISYHVMQGITFGFLNPSEYAVEGDKHKANGNINGFAWLSFTFCKVTIFFTFSK